VFGNKSSISLKCTSDGRLHVTNVLLLVQLFEEFVAKNRQSHLKEKFDHTWLSEKSLSFCEATRIWNVVFIEGFEIYCLLCKKHNTKNNRNKSTVFSEVPSTHYKFQYEVNFPSETEISISSLFYYHLFAITLSP
jgi:hypothetical protein